MSASSKRGDRTPQPAGILLPSLCETKPAGEQKRLHELLIRLTNADDSRADTFATKTAGRSTDLFHKGLSGPRHTIPVDLDDIRTLEASGFIRKTEQLDFGDLTFVVTSNGRRHAGELSSGSVPSQQTVHTVPDKAARRVAQGSGAAVKVGLRASLASHPFAINLLIAILLLIATAIGAAATVIALFR
jgi:hypothetical protein